MHYEKIEEALHYLRQMDELAKRTRSLLNELITDHDAQDDVAVHKRTLFRVIEGGKFFPTSGKTEKETPDTGTSGEEVEQQAFVKFTEKEILQMPKQFRKIFRINKQTARVRFHKGSYEIRMQINGHRICAYGKYLDVAKERFIEKLKNTKIDIVASPKQKLLVDYVYQWLETVKKPFIKANTYKMYLQLIGAYIKPAFEKRTIESLTQFELQEFINGFCSDGRNRTAQKIAQLLSAVLDYAVDDGIIPRSPMKRVVVARYEEEHGQSLTRSEEKILLDAFAEKPNEYAQAYVFMLYTGLRRSELASAEISDGWISVITGKQRRGAKPKRRRMPICPMLKPLLEKIDLATIKAISAGMLTKHIKDFLPSHHCHNLRHTFITRAQECGIKREIVSLWAGHAPDSSITSNVYTHLEQNEEHQIAEMSLFSYVLE